MLENDTRDAHKGFRHGQKVSFRWSGTDYKGEITRLTSSKAVIRFVGPGGEMTSKYVSYSQIKVSETT